MNTTPIVQQDELIIQEPDEKNKWYVLYVAITKEYKVRDRILKLDKHKSKIKEILIPTKRKIVVNKTKVSESFKNIYPGYLFILMDIDSSSFNDISSLEDVFFFLGSSETNSKDFVPPEHLKSRELKRLEDGINKEKNGGNKNEEKFSINDYVCVVGGLFKNLKGYIREIKNNMVIIELEDDAIVRKIAVTISIDCLTLVN